MRQLASAPPPPRPDPERPRPAAAVLRREIRAFYSRPSAATELGLVAVALCYIGGGAMFWLHCVRRGEHGPEIADGYHWLLDSTLALVLLTPALFVMLPATRSAVARLRVAARLRRPVQAVLLAGIFSLLTAPGPLLHERLAGYGTPVANLATSIFGHNPTVAQRAGHLAKPSLLEECILQIGFGLPVYAACSGLALRAGSMAGRHQLTTSGAPEVQGRFVA